MARLVVVLGLIVLLSVFVESREWRSVKRVKRGYNNGFSSDGAYGRSDEQDASVSKEGRNACNGEGDNGYSGSREHLAYNRDGRSNENHRGHRSFTKASASASATAFNQNHNLAV